MIPWDPLLPGLLVAAFCGAALNAVAGGGSFLTFPALLLAGLGPIAANATSTVALWPGSVGSAWGYRSHLSEIRRWLLPLGLISLAGGWAGARLLLRTGDARFAQLIPLLLGGATLLLALQRAPAAAPSHPAAVPPRRAPLALLLLAQAAIAVYGGFFGGGIGILMLAAFAWLGLPDLHAANGLKSVLGAAINGVAVVVLAVGGQVDWRRALPMLLAAWAGGYWGARAARRLPALWLRRGVVAVGAALTLWFAREPFAAWVT